MTCKDGKAGRAAAPRVVADREHEAVYERLVAEYRAKHGKEPGIWSKLLDQAKAEVASKLVRGTRRRNAPKLFEGIMRDLT